MAYLAIGPIVNLSLGPGVKFYKATSPKMIVEYLNDKKKDIEKQEQKVNQILPLLLQLEKEKQEEKEATIFTGIKGVKTGFTNLVNELKKGDEVYIMGVYEFGDKFLPLGLFFQRIRSRKGIKAKFLINKNARDIADKFSKYPPVEIKLMPENMITPAIFLIYKDKVIINLAKELTFFVIKSKSANLAFDSYFQILWNSIKNRYF